MRDLMETDAVVRRALAANRYRNERLVQRTDALASANRRRDAIKALKDDLHADPSWTLLGDILERRVDRPHVDSARIRGLLLVMPGVGEVKAAAILRAAGIREHVHTRRLGELTDEQRRALAEELLVRRRNLSDHVLERIAQGRRFR
jgi:hypothetical protein